MKITIATLLILVLLSGCATPNFISLMAPPATQPTYDMTFLLSKEDATAIALDHARISAEQVNHVSVELDFDDGRPEYEIEFIYNTRKYEYNIHGESGRIISFERDD